ncbi:HD domain-containing phosphohydrolase [Silvimonas iriomotensis]|uniref:Phosphohydrolase n=1 Tax=Silvimonas iriomotensis TaxID=449662 RepID=A0ABQ2P5D0_9NEIS|nr:HD domain-containing phosphohydrolase [Silvimonas iriomotensis]GGP18620.1 hypothetical protein GCM10010970_05970 [Silvimonas iriomotensis]
MDLVAHLLNSLFTMASLVEARDPYTGGHLWRVSQLSYLMAQDLGLPPEAVAQITLGGFLHDLGKIGVPDAILHKPGPLTDEEYATIRTHPETGARLLGNHPLAYLAIDAVLKHHETPDGKGYPQGLAGEDIPLAAGIVGIADAFDAMTSTRPYRQGMPINTALDIIQSKLDTQFDRVLGERFIEMGRTGVFDEVVGHSEPGVRLQSCPSCGPIIAVPRRTRSGDIVACPACRTRIKVVGNHEDWMLVPLPEKESAPPLQLDPDLVRAMAHTIRTALGESVRVSG